MTQLVSTRSTAIQPAEHATAMLDVELRYAKAVASAGDVLPRSYRGNPGAVLLAKAWADSRGVDVLTAIQTVSFVDGKPVVDATMQRALADRQGFDVRVVDVSPQAATVEVWRGETMRGAATYTLDDAASAGLANKQNWQRHPQAMLVARATTQALRWFAPTVVVGIIDADEIDTPADPVQVLTVTATEPESIEEADVVEDPPVKSNLEVLKDAVKTAGIRQADLIQDARTFAQTVDAEAPPNLQAIADDPQLLDWALAQLSAGVTP